MKVVHFERQPTSEQHSMRRVFDAVRSALPKQLALKNVHCPTPAHSHCWLLQGILRAWRERGEVNHILGDVHYVALALPGSKSILTVHDLNRLDSLTGLRRIVYRWLYFAMPLRHCAVITAISNATRARIVADFPFTTGKIVVISNPVPKAYKFHASTFNKKCPRILQVGSASHKNVMRLLQSVNGISCRLHIIGTLSEAIREELESANVAFENSVDISDEDVLDAYIRCDLVAFASLKEGFGMPIIEANAIGRPVVTSDIEPLASVAGDAACMVNPLDPASIRSGILRVIEDHEYREQLVRNGLQNAKRFSAETVAQSYFTLYERLSISSKAHGS